MICRYNDSNEGNVVIVGAKQEDWNEFIYLSIESRCEKQLHDAFEEIDSADTILPKIA